MASRDIFVDHVHELLAFLMVELAAMLIHPFEIGGSIERWVHRSDL